MEISNTVLSAGVSTELMPCGSSQSFQPGSVGVLLPVLHPSCKRSSGVCKEHPRLPDSQPAWSGHAAQIRYFPGMSMKTGLIAVAFNVCLFSSDLYQFVSNADLTIFSSQVLMVRFCSLFDPKERTVTFLNGQTYSLASLRALGMGCLLDAMFDFSEKLGSLGLEPDEMALFMAVVLVSAGETHSHSAQAHEHVQYAGAFPQD